MAVQRFEPILGQGSQKGLKNRTNIGYFDTLFGTHFDTLQGKTWAF